MTDLYDISTQLARNRLSPRAEEIARLAIVDTCACILAGLRTRQATRVAQMLAADGATGAAAQALRLGTAAHALDFDDYEDQGSTHPSACILPALLALSGQKPKTGQMLKAYVQGYEAILTFGEAMGHAHYLAGWHSTATLGGLGAAAAVASYLDLTLAQTATALSLAATMASGLKRQFGSDTKALHCGFAARTGVDAALLAQAGLTAKLDILTGQTGFLAVLGGKSDAWHARPQPRIEDHPPYVKPWPCCAYTHRTIEAAEALAPRIELSQIAAITLDIPQPYLDVAGYRAPKSEAEARFSNSFCAASTLIDGRLTPASFEDEAMHRAEVRALEALIDSHPYPLPPGAGDMSADAPDTLTIVLHSGQRLAQCVAETRGSPSRPLTSEGLLEKFAACGGDPDTARGFLAAPVTAPFLAPISLHHHDRTDPLS